MSKSRRVSAPGSFGSGCRLPTSRDTNTVAVREGRINYEQAGRFLKFYEEGLQGYTYLEEPDER